MSRCWRSQQGSVSLTLTWFMLTALLLAIGLDSFLGIYIARQQGQSAAVAAALAVTREITAYLPDAVRAEAAARVDTLVRDPIAVEAIREYTETLDRQQALCRVTPGCTPLTGEEITRLIRAVRVQEYQAAFTRHYRGSLGLAMAERIADGTWGTASASTLRDELIPDDQELGCLVISLARVRQADLLVQADALAQANRAGLDWTRTEVGLSRGRHRVVVKRTVHPFGAEWLFSDGNLPTLHIEEVAVLRQVGSRTPHYPEHC